MARLFSGSGALRLVPILLLLVGSLIGPPRIAVADDLPAARGPILLTVSGQIGASDGPMQFDRAGLESLGLRHLKTHTYWTDGVQDFEGVLFRDLLRAVDAQGTVALMVALNDYSVEIPLSDATSYDVLIAVKQNGSDMPIRDKGPLWLIYPIDDHPELDRKLTADKMIWQLSRIIVK
ncbi:MAG: molybdopterin-dependent oxidoreductase [Pseudomonadota bacterium]